MAKFYFPKWLFTLLCLLLYSTGSFAQYCAAGSTTNGCSTGDEYMSNITFGAFSKSTLCEVGMYADYTATDTVTVTQGQIVTASVTTGNYFSGDQFYIWIDFNQDGDFTDLGEEFALPSGSATGSGFITIPFTATAGATRMRARVNYSGAMSPCGSPSYGEVEDYTIVINAAPGCTGTPTAGNAYAPASVCAGQAFLLSDTASTAAAGLTYQWEESPANAGVWSPIGGATNVFYTVSAGITTATDYHLVVTCTNGGGTATSNIVSVAMGSFYSCYCSPLIGTTLSSYPGSNFITKVEIPGTTLNNSTSAAGNGGYTPYSSSVPNQTTTLIPGLTYTLNVDMLYTYDEAAAWIDFDADGSFGSSEFITLTNNNATGASGIFTAPVTAAPGLTGLRVRVNDWGNTYGATDACMDDDGGETEDYVVNVATLLPCGGTPVAGNTYGPDSVCAGIPFTMMDTAFTIAGALTFQWESSPTGAGVWLPIAGATNTLYTETAGITAPTDYHLVVTCTNGGGTDVSSSFTVNLNPFYKCYCSPLTATTLSTYTGTNFITKVEVPGTSLNSNTTSSTTGYTLYTGAVPSQTATLIPGLTYSLNVEMQYSYDYDYSAAWIDFDQDGSFGSTEYITLTSNNTTGSSGLFIAPITATPGLTGLRVRVNDYSNSYGSTDACMNDGAGETEDYLVTVATLTACSGTPVAGTTYGPDSVCAGIPFNMMDTAFTIASGITFQWESSPAGAGVWTPIAGATNSLYTETAGITSPTDYHFIITCSNGGGTDVSSTFTVNLSQFYKCYCASSPEYEYDGEISNVTIGSFSNSSTCSQTGGTGSILNQYSDYTSVLPAISLTQAVPYFSSVTAGSCGGNYDAWVKIYIDLDHDGAFTSAGEEMYSGQPPGGQYTSTGVPAAGVVTIPTTSMTGVTRMRVILWQTNSGSTVVPCQTGYPYNYGETEDYLVDIAAAVACNGVPVGGTAYGPDSVCANIPFTLSDTAMTTGLGVTYQWESSPAGAGVWTTVLGATSPFYTETAGITAPTDYHLIVTCTNGGGADVSNTVTIGMNSFYKCYCSPLTGTTLSTYWGTNYVTSVDIAGTTLSNSSSNAGPGGYTLYTNTTPTQTATLIPGLSYTLNVGMMYPQYDDAGAWGDFDGDGAFGSSEFIALTNNNTTGASGTFIVPVAATPGLTGLRVRVNDWGNVYSATDGCMDDNGGETEDYLVTVATLAACTGTPNAGTAYGPASSICPGLPLTLSDTAFSIGAGLTYQWESSPAGAGVWTTISGATMPSYVLNSGIVSATDFHLIATCANGGGVDTSNMITLSPTNFTAPYVQPFNINGLPGCWSTSATGTSGWQYSQGSGPAYDVAGATEHTGNGGYFAWVDGSYVSGGATATIMSPAIDISSLTTPRLRYYVVSYNPTYTAANGNNKLVVSGWDGSSWVTLDSIQQSLPQGWNERIVSLSALGPVTTTQLRYTFTATATTSFYNDILIDDVNLENTPTCVAPTGLAATNVTTTSTDLAWTENGTATQWSIEYGPTGFTPGAGTYVSTTTNPYTLSGLSAGTAYDIYVKSICSATDSSFVNGPVNINTDQIPVTSYPYAINWDNGGGGWTYANGSEANKWFVGAPGDNPAAAFGATPGGLYISNDGGVTNGYNNGTSSTVHAYRDLDLSSFSSAVPLTFNSYIVGEASTPYIYDYLSVWMVPISYDPIPGTDLSTVTGAVPIDTIVLETGWTQHLLNIPASVTGSTARLVLQWQNDGSSGSAPVKVDNLTIGGFPLVIKLRDISATNLGAKNRVDWSTESELKSDKFELERSADGRNFTYLATIKAKGEASNYSYVDISPVTGVNYYRLKMIDAAGAVATSKVVTATVKQGAFTVEAYPNPVSEKLTVQVYGGSDQNATVSITDVTGKVMKVVSVVNGKAEVNMNGLASGVYLVKYTDNNHSQTIKVNKQ